MTCAKHPVLSSLTDGPCPLCAPAEEPEVVVSPKGSAHATIGSYRVTAFKRRTGAWTWKVYRDGTEVGLHAGPGFGDRDGALLAGIAFAGCL